MVFHVTERLLLRPAWPEDWEAILAGVADEAVATNLARAPWPYGAEDARAFARLPQDPERPHFVIVESATGAVIGSAGMGEHAGEPEIGYWLARSHWGRGYATEAAAGVLAVARMLGYRRIVAGHFADNPASGRVLRRLGFAPTGRGATRHSRARGRTIPSVEYAIDLEAPDAPAMRAA